MKLGRRTVEERFWKKIAPPNENGCRLWTAAKYLNGYGHFYVGKRDDGSHHHEGAHRYALMMTGVTIPEGSEVHHACPNGPNRACVEVSHLRVVTRKDHYPLDKKRIGEGQHCSKLTEDDVRWLRWVYTDGRYSQRQLARHLGVSQQLIRMAVNRKTWRHVR